MTKKKNNTESTELRREIMDSQRGNHWLWLGYTCSVGSAHFASTKGLTGLGEG